MTIWKNNPTGSLKRSSKLTRDHFFRIQQYKHRQFNVAPINVVQPTVSGSTAPTEEATTDNGEWESNAPTTFEYQWQLDGVDIPAATTATLLLLVAWVGQTVRCVVKCKNKFGFTLAFSTSFVVAL